MKILEHKKILMIALVLILGLVGTWMYIIDLYKDSLKDIVYNSKEVAFDNAKADLELAINQSLSFAYGLRGFVISQENNQVDKKVFDIYAQETQVYSDTIKNFSIAPDNIQTYV